MKVTGFYTEDEPILLKFLIVHSFYSYKTLFDNRILAIILHSIILQIIFLYSAYYTVF